MMNLFQYTIGAASMPGVTQINIVCGDCAGDELLPIKTKLTTDGRCAECGGRSYEFASLIGAALARYLRNNKEEKDHVNKQTNSTNRSPANEAEFSKRALRLVG